MAPLVALVAFVSLLVPASTVAAQDASPPGESAPPAAAGDGSGDAGFAEEGDPDRCATDEGDRPGDRPGRGDAERPGRGDAERPGRGDAERPGRGEQAPAGDETRGEEIAGEIDDPCAPPRCGTLVDVTPDADEPTCMEPARLGALIADFEAAAAEEVEVLAELSAVLLELDQLNVQLDALMLRVGEVRLRLADAGVDARFARLRHDVAGEGLDDVRAALADEEDRLREQAVDSYMGGGAVELGVETALADMDAGNEAGIAREYASVVIDDQLDTVDRVDALRQAVERLDALVAEVEASAVADEDRIAGIADEAAELARAQRSLVRSAEAEAEALAERIGEIQARKSSYAAQLASSGAGGGSVGGLLAETQAGQTPPTGIAGLLALPLENTTIGSPFGPRVHPIFGGMRMHTGLDLSGASGQQIVASAEGLVVMAGEMGGYGNAVVIDHGNTVSTLYAHMTTDAVEVGQVVEAGELIGFVGSTGFSTGPHLHYEVRIMGQPVDPISYLDFGSPPTVD
ncbi:MAG: peptidoglycan DD-metalloendopeptidase family protein [Acidimicrobiales bacterium]